MGTKKSKKVIHEKEDKKGESEDNYNIVALY